MTCLIVDDNPGCRDVIRHLASQVEDLHILGECSTATEASDIILSQAIDVVFTNAAMPQSVVPGETEMRRDRTPVII